MTKTFEVHYSFTCPSCLKPNEGRKKVGANDVVHARDVARSNTSCSPCGKKLPLHHHFTATIKEIDS
jgi:hypothetical protein